MGMAGASNGRGLNLLASWHVGAAILLAITGRLIYLFGRYAAGNPAVHKYEIEAAGFVFALVGLALKAARSEFKAIPGVQGGRLSLWWWPGFCGLAIALYWPALFVGFLSDDFALTRHAAAWQLGPVTRELFRPLPLLVWSVLLHVKASSLLFHLLNILLHGTNAFLTVEVVKGWQRDLRAASVAGLIVLTSPLSPEAVVWCSGVFDVMATTFILLTLLASRRYAHRPSPRVRLLLYGLALAALLSKETAAVGPVLLLLDAWIRKDRSRELLTDSLALLVIFGGISVARLWPAATTEVASPVTKYVLQRALFTSFGDFAAPWRPDLPHALPLMLLHGVSILLLATLFFLGPSPRANLRHISGGILWVIVPLLPVLPFFFIGPDLQGSRYVYVSTVGWASLIGAMVATVDAFILRRVGSALVGVVLLASVLELRLHLQPWTEAADARDLVRREALAAAVKYGCREMWVSDLPDNLRGAYVFRVGAPEALSDAQHTVHVGRESHACAFRWDGYKSFVRIDR